MNLIARLDDAECDLEIRILELLTTNACVLDRFSATFRQEFNAGASSSKDGQMAMRFLLRQLDLTSGPTNFNCILLRRTAIVATNVAKLKGSSTSTHTSCQLLSRWEATPNHGGDASTGPGCLHMWDDSEAASVRIALALRAVCSVNATLACSLLEFG